MFFRILHLACGLMIVLLGVKIYAIAGDFLDDSGTADVTLTAPAMAQPKVIEPTSTPALSPDNSTPSSQLDPKQTPTPVAASTASEAKADVTQTSNLCAGGGCNGNTPSSIPTVSASDPALSSQLAERQKELDRLAATLNNRQRLVDAAEEELQRRMTAMENSRSALVTSQQQADQLVGQDADRLVKIYQAMKPEDAAAIFNILDLKVGVALLGRMPPRRASAIMEAMTPQRAILATQLLANTHAHPVVQFGGNG